MKTNEEKKGAFLLRKTHFLAKCQANGSIIYEESFRLTPILIQMLTKIRTYLIENKTNGSFQLKNNLFLSGNTLTGKTCFMALLKTLLDSTEHYQIRSCLEIEHQIKKYGNSYLNTFFNKNTCSWCFDDFGKRTTLSHLKTLKKILRRIKPSETNIHYHIVSDYSIEAIEQLLGEKYGKQIKRNFIILTF